MSRFDEALASFDRAIGLRPNLAEAHFNAALCLLLVGDLRRGWAKYEWRWQTDQLRSERRNFTQPQWTGPDEIAGKTILIHAEQGLGDTIQFCRYLPQLAKRAGRLIFEVQKPLVDLIKTLPGGAQIIGRGDPCPISICIARCSACRWHSTPNSPRFRAKAPISLQAKPSAQLGASGSAEIKNPESAWSGPAIRASA